MKILKPIVLGTITFSLAYACNTEPKTTDLDDQKCLSSFELNEQNDTFNKTYCDQKEGHWITKVWNDKKDRYKTEEGYYKNNKKEGYWKFYNIDGTLKDSIEYKNDVAVTH